MSIIIDFLVLGAFGVALIAGFVTIKNQMPHNTAFILGASLAFVAAFLEFWVVGAVGIFGSSDLLELLALPVLTVLTYLWRFKPFGMARALSAAAIAQILVGIIACANGTVSADYWLREIMLNSFFVVLFVGSALAFWKAAQNHAQADDPGPNNLRQRSNQSA